MKRTFLREAGLAAAEAIKDVHLLGLVEVIDSELVQVIEHFGGDRAVDFAPPEVLVRGALLHNPLVFRGTAGEFASIDSEGTIGGNGALRGDGTEHDGLSPKMKGLPVSKLTSLFSFSWRLISG